MSASISSRDGMYTGRDPGGGASSRDKNMRVPNPPDQVRPPGYRKGHQRQFSDPAALVDIEGSSSKYLKVPKFLDARKLCCSLPKTQAKP